MNRDLIHQAASEFVAIATCSRFHRRPSGGVHQGMAQALEIASGLQQALATHAGDIPAADVAAALDREADSLEQMIPVMYGPAATTPTEVFEVVHRRWKADQELREPIASLAARRTMGR